MILLSPGAMICRWETRISPVNLHVAEQRKLPGGSPRKKHNDPNGSRRFRYQPFHGTRSMVFYSASFFRLSVSHLSSSSVPVVDHPFQLAEHFEWKIDEPLHTRPRDRQSFTFLAYCSRRDSQQLSTHIAKLLPEKATRSQSELFERQAYLAAHLFDAVEPIISYRLDSPQPILVYPRLQGMRADDWFYSQADWVTRAHWIAISQALLLQLRSLHKFGYMHGHVRPEHVWIGEAGQVKLLGLGNCEPIGNSLSARVATDRFDPPETRLATFEASSAQDIYSAAIVIDLISGGLFSKTKVANCMQTSSPNDRPTSGELVQLFESFRIELCGGYSLASIRAA